MLSRPEVRVVSVKTKQALRVDAHFSARSSLWQLPWRFLGLSRTQLGIRGDRPHWELTSSEWSNKPRTSCLSLITMQSGGAALK